MKKLIGLYLLCLISVNSFAQKCKEVSDPITNEKKYEFENIGSTIYHYLKYEIKNGNCTLTKEFYYSGAMSAPAPAGTELFFKLENGEVVKLKTAKDASPKMYAGYGVSTGYTFVLAVTKSDLNKLAASPVVLIRLPKISEEGYYDIDKKNYVVKKSKKGFMKGAACMGMYLQ